MYSTFLFTAVGMFGDQRGTAGDHEGPQIGVNRMKAPHLLEGRGWNTVMLSTAKHLDAHRARPFAPLRVTREHCHAERSEGSQGPTSETLRSAQGDKKEPSRQTLRSAQGDTKGRTMQ